METKMYTTLFNAITDALEDLDKGDLAEIGRASCRERV